MSFLERVAIVVHDYDEAIRFFVDTLGFELVEDSPSLTTDDGRPKRWVVVRPPGAETSIVLARADGDEQAAAVGRQTGGRAALLVLDEPANGLDPAGIRHVRELLRDLGRQGRTVFVSSHILSEVEQTCDAVAILHRGRCVAQGSVSSVLASAGPSGLLVKVGDLPAGLDVLRRAGVGAERADGYLRVAVAPSAAGEITRLLATEQLWITELRPEERTLEDLFLELTRDDEPVERGAATAVAGGTLQEVGSWN